MADKASVSTTRSVGRGRGRSRSKSITSPGGLAAEQTTSGSGSSSDTTGPDSAISSLSRSMAATTLDSRPQPKLTTMGRGKVAAKPSDTSSKPSGLSTTSETSTSSKSSGDSIPLATRPGFGKVGRPIWLRANCFTLKINGDLAVYQYRIDLALADGYKGQVNREESFAVFWDTATKNKWTDDPFTVLYDGGGSCFTLKKLNLELTQSGHFRLEVEHATARFGRKRYAISIGLTGLKKVSFTSGDPKTTLMSLTVLDLIFRQKYNYPMDHDVPFYPFGRSFFHRPRNYDRTCFELDTGREVWGGYYFAAAMGIDFVPILNIDVANGIFLKDESVLQFMCDVLNAAAGSNRYHLAALAGMTTPYKLKPMEVGALTKAIKGYYVISKTASSRHQRVIGITDQDSDTLTFELKDRQSGTARKVSVTGYFLERYRITLKHPYFPCLQVGSKSKFGYLPLEICNIMAPQRVRGKLTETQTSTMIKGVCTDAVERERRIQDVIDKAGMHKDPFAQKFGVSLNVEMMRVQGRVQAPPNLEYFGGVKAMPRDGAWNLGNGMKLYHAAPIASYGLISFISNSAQNELQDLCGNLMQQARKLGMTVTNLMPDGVFYIGEGDKQHIHNSIDGVIAECARKGNKCDLILFPTYSRNTETYATVKSYCEKHYGLATQFILQKTIRKGNPQTWSNLILKINAKLGGINWKLVADSVSNKYLVDQPTMVIGLDVTHPNPTDSKLPSIGAAVGNIDLYPGMFGADVVVQKHRREEVLYLVDAIRNRVSAFFKQTGKRPERIIIYRDGVAEGQFSQVLKEEMKGVRLGLAACADGTETKITYVVVQKRHHVRFFCTEARDQCGRAKNVPPGTTIDSVITDPQLYDFYLCSHFGIQGTSRPTHYHVLMDDNKFTEDELQALTYQLCHIYFRCTRSVSIPAPVYYAHLACERARYHLHHIVGGDDDDKMSDTCSTISGMSDDATEDQMKRSTTVADNLQRKMYFC